MATLPKNKKLILFDGVCNLCNQSVQKIIRFDKHNVFVFASLQSEIGQKIINQLNIDTKQTDSIILYTPTKFYIKSSAILKIMNSFGGFWKLSKILWIFPKPLRDLVYDFVAKNRYKWYGKKEQCMIPSSKINSKFLN